MKDQWDDGDIEVRGPEGLGVVARFPRDGRDRTTNLHALAYYHLHISVYRSGKTE